MSSATDADARPAGRGDLPGLPRGPLLAHLSATAPALAVPDLETSLVSGGRSNLTYLLASGDRRWVLRRPPLGAVNHTAHDVGREYRMLVALHPSPVPVPEPVVLADGDRAVAAVGAPFYVMGFADGDVLRTTEQLTAVARPDVLARRMVTTLADLHAVDPAEVGLDTLGRPDGYLERQLVRWNQQVAANASPHAEAFAALAARLEASRPATQRTTVVHGDYRLDNVVVGGATTPDPTVVAVLDWEMATRGDPLADLASTIAWWDGMTGLDLPVATMPGEVSGYPAGAALVEHYASLSDLDLSDLPWYVGFAFFKVAGIFDGLRRRTDDGLSVGDGFDRLGPLVPDLVARGHAALD